MLVQEIIKKQREIYSGKKSLSIQLESLTNLLKEAAGSLPKRLSVAISFIEAPIGNEIEKSSIVIKLRLEAALRIVKKSLKDYIAAEKRAIAERSVMTPNLISSSSSANEIREETVKDFSVLLGLDSDESLSVAPPSLFVDALSTVLEQPPLEVDLDEMYDELVGILTIPRQGPSVIRDLDPEVYGVLTSAAFFSTIKVKRPHEHNCDDDALDVEPQAKVARLKS